jgi:hypothetical protein
VDTGSRKRKRVKIKAAERHPGFKKPIEFHSLVMRGLDPRIHQEKVSPGDGLPGQARQ